MAAKETKVYPVRGRTLAGVPAAVHVVPTRADADALVASGAFTLNAHDADRLDDAPDLGSEPIAHENVVFFGEPPPGEPAPEPTGPAETGGSSDSEES
jgi:hypothetical protein